MPKSFNEFIARLGGWHRIGLGFVGVGALGVIWAFGQWVAAPEWVTLTDGMDEVPDVVRQLEDDGIPYRLEGGGERLLVRAPDVAKARVGLAQAGIGAQTGGFQLFDQGNWGITDFAEKVNYRRALETELSRTITELDGVQDTRVHLAIEPRSFLTSGDSQNEASVVLFLRPGYEPEAPAVTGIATLVSRSVERLAPGNVTVVDNSGRILSSESAAGIGLSDQQLGARQETEAYLEHKAQELLSPLVGPGNSRVTASVEMDFDQIDRHQTVVDPDQQVAVSEERSEIIPSNEDQGASQVQSSTVYESSTTEEVLVRHGARVTRLTVAVLVNDREIPEADSIRHVARTDEELAQLESLVRNGLGISADRGDEITVVGLSFEPVPEIAPPGFNFMGLLDVLLRPLIGILALVLAYLVATRAMKNLKEMAPPPGLRYVPQAEGVGAGGGEAGPALSGDGEGARRLELNDPAMTAKVVRAWLKD
ncbi:MAG: flagellar basal-body MS-ring/collar protein FliF [Longimicrobiales bacterium]